MVHAAPGFSPDLGDAPNLRTLPAFFGVLELLVGAGLTTVAEAAFQDRLWRPGLAASRGRADIRTVRRSTDTGVAPARRLRRAGEDPVRTAHEPAAPIDPTAHALGHDTFDRVSVDAPWIEVDTTDGYDPGFMEIVAFAGTGGIAG
ncbi:ATP-binding protein [Streptomyces sp. PSRA5]|uniref:ATP-binding protein n=1 Tax=Streptomyces panacea TaxID=3035064 RepID=UPI00339CCA28